MILVTKLGHKVNPIRMGEPDYDGICFTIYGVDMDSTERDLLGKRIVEKYSITDFSGFLGSFTFPYFYKDK